MQKLLALLIVAAVGAFAYRKVKARPKPSLPTKPTIPTQPGDPSDPGYSPPTVPTVPS